MREIIVFGQRLVVVGMEFGKEEILHQADLVLDRIDSDGRERRRCIKSGEGSRGKSAEECQ